MDLLPKRVLIVFTDIHLPYSPSTLTLFYNLKKKRINVELIAPEPQRHYSLQKIYDKDIRYIDTGLNRFNKIQYLYNKAIWYISGSKEDSNMRLQSEKSEVFIKEIRKAKSDIIIAVDFFSLWCVNQAGKNAHLLSLEIHEDDQFKKKCNLSSILTVLIQSQERYNFLFDGKIKPPFYLLPNSPEFIDFIPKTHVREKGKLIYCGSAMSEFGIYSCLDFVADFPEYSLTIKGAVPPPTLEGINKFYPELVKNGKLIINDEYLDPISLAYFISDFRIGFAFYDFYRFVSMRKFNYYSVPSGKIYQYFNSGVPVIGNKLDGFNIITEYNAGTLIPTLSSNYIKQAINYIESDYMQICSNSKQISYDYDSRNYLLKWINDVFK